MQEQIKKQGIHSILAQSYYTFFGLFLVGIVFDALYPLALFKDLTLKYVGFSFIVFATLLILWAQKTSKNLKKENVTKETFLGGPYKYTRSPTHFGLLFLFLGFGLIINAFFIALSSLVSFLLSKLFFLKKEEKLLVEKYGNPYSEYQKSVKL